MEISKIIGVLEEIRGVSNARIKVYSAKRGRNYINDIDVIEEMFPPSGYIFSPSFFSRNPTFQLGDLIELGVNLIDYRDKKELDPILNDSGAMYTGFPIYEVDKSIFINDKSIEISKLKQYNLRGNRDFFLYDNDFIYGIFKIDQNSIKPKFGKEIQKYKIDDSSIILYEDIRYIISTPSISNKIYDIDCMNSFQIINWLKDKFKLNNQGPILTLISDTISEIEFSGLEQARLEKAKHYINDMKLTYEEIQSIIKENIDFKTRFDVFLEKAKDEIKREFRVSTEFPLQESKRKLEYEINNLNNQLTGLKQSNDEINNNIKLLSSDLTEKKKEVEKIVMEKNRHIEDIKIHSMVNNTTAIQPSNKFTTFEIRNFSSDYIYFKDINEFINLFETVAIEPRLYRNCILQFKEYKCILSNNITFVLSIAKSTNNCKVFIQNVEPDWLKFEYFYENGLKQIWQSAHNYPEIIHFYLLQDINMSSIECYGKPILDLIMNIRTILPGTNQSFPTNLWIIGFPIDTQNSKEYGLPLNKNTFKYWGAFQKTDFNDKIDIVSSNYALKPDTFFKHDLDIPPNIDLYFE